MKNTHFYRFIGLVGLLISQSGLAQNYDPGIKTQEYDKVQKEFAKFQVKQSSTIPIQRIHTVIDGIDFSASAKIVNSQETRIGDVYEVGDFISAGYVYGHRVEAFFTADVLVARDVTWDEYMKKYYRFSVIRPLANIHTKGIGQMREIHDLNAAQLACVLQQQETVARVLQDSKKAAEFLTKMKVDHIQVRLVDDSSGKKDIGTLSYGPKIQDDPYLILNIVLKEDGTCVQTDRAALTQQILTWADEHEKREQILAHPGQTPAEKALSGIHQVNREIAHSLKAEFTANVNPEKSKSNVDPSREPVQGAGIDNNQSATDARAGLNKP